MHDSVVIKNISNSFTINDNGKAYVASCRNLKSDKVVVGDKVSYDMVNNKAKAMDDKRTDKTASIFSDYDIFVRQNAALYIWGDYSKDTKKAYEALIKNENNAKALGIKGTDKVNYDNIAVGYFVFNNVTYWCVLMATT